MLSFDTIRKPATLVPLLVLALLALVPVIATAAEQPFYISFFARIIIYAIAATALNLALGYGGLVSLGHALFLGIGAYSVAIPAFHGIGSGWVHLAVCVVSCTLVGLVTGAVSLRTTGIGFIMITLAFAQMLFYLANSIKGYGGDEGLNIRARSAIGFGLDLKDPTTFYYVAIAVLVACLWALARFVPSRLGRAVLAIRDDEQRAEALGFPTFRLRWLVFVVAGMVAGLAGALSVNQQGYVSPNVLHWTQSGTLMVMVILGGVATLWGGLVGAAALLLLQEVLSAYTPHWEFWTGWVLLAVVLFARQGLAGLLRGPKGR